MSCPPAVFLTRLERLKASNQACANYQMGPFGGLTNGTASYEGIPEEIAPDHYWVMGDNRGNSKDSRVFGTIEKSKIVGRVFIRIWPFTRFGFM